MTYKIAVAITVHNRHEMAEFAISQWKKHLPKEAKLFIVDDGSDRPFKYADHRNEIPKGIAGAKNDCFELCDYADYIFLADDDTFPIKSGWHLPYINSGQNHLCFTFNTHSDYSSTGRNFLYNSNGLSYYGSPCGCMLFFTKKCLETVGGMDEQYGRWGMEHVGLTMRIHNAGLTLHPFMDITDSLDYFHSEDYHKTAVRSVPNAERAKLIRINQAKYQREIKSSHFIPYKKLPKNKHENIIITSYFNYANDPQRGNKWKSEIDDLMPLINSCERLKVKLLIFTDCIEYTSNYVYCINIKPSLQHSPNVYRWIVYNDWLQSNEFEKAWFVDSTDVELLRDPFNNSLDFDVLYCGDEHGMITENNWLRNTQEKYLRIHDYRFVISAFSDSILLNCGVIGGNYNIISNLLSKWAELSSSKPLGLRVCSDMAIFNYLARKYYNNKLIHGDLINTKFKHYEENNKTAIWRHK